MMKMRIPVSSERAQILQSNYLSIKQVIPSHVCLVAVSKTKPLEEIEYLYTLGQRDFGENHVQELKEKSFELAHLSEIRWHMIGHLQSNKINDLLKVKNLYALHSVDSLKILELLKKKEAGAVLRIFLQVNISREQEKYGFDGDEELLRALNDYSTCENKKLLLLGLMGMAPIRIDDNTTTKLDEARSAFQRLNAIKNKLISSPLIGHFLNSKIELSMGMSDDYQVAIEEGSTFVRAGSILFR
ncbi:MAG: YggS family pyridoxal phosphate-dependent enzyme [Bacteriovoracaceae bacterium]|nr:YggS family pyridoxal phosphate-dependent enzyme [Bacteriovoracaceae bacterium]